MSTFQYPGSALSEQHRRALLASAEGHRLIRLAHGAAPDRRLSVSPSRRCLAAMKRAVAVQFRPIRAGDDVLLDDVFQHLGPESRRRRFLGTKNVLTPKELHYLTNVDHHDHEAIVAVSRSDGRGLGVARFVREVDDARSAEVAVSVIDERQFQGIGTQLIGRLSHRALAEGVTQFSALVLEENVAAQRLLGHLPGSPVVVDRYEDRVSYVVELVGGRRG
jgi:GNAT superfamily N-acetyltransferase